MRHPKISIITSTLNATNDLLLTIESLRSQKYTNFELIIIDALSRDGIENVVNLNKDVVRKFISEPDSGIYDAWNKGLKLAEGDYISFLGAGDGYINEVGLERLVNFALENPDFDFISSKILTIEKGQIGGVIGRPWIWKKFRLYMGLAHVGSLHSRRLFCRYGEFNSDFKIAGDYEFLLRAGADLKAGFLNEITAYMKAGGVSQVDNRSFKESELAKIKNKARGRVLSRADRLIAELKFKIKNVF